MNNKLPLAIIGKDAPFEIGTALQDHGFSVLCLDGDERLSAPVRSHADMLLFFMDNTVFCSDEYFQKHKSTFSIIEDYGYHIIKCALHISDRYPNDIAFNIAHIGNCIYGNLKHSAKEITEFAEERKIKSVQVKQGYAKCSTVILNGNAIITADSRIAEAASKNGIAVLTIENSPRAVHIDGYDYGFLGGACGVFEDKIYFTGNIGRHPQGDKISNFCLSNGSIPISLSDSILTDIGGIIFIPPLV